MIEDIIESYFYSNYSVLYHYKDNEIVKSFKTFHAMKKWLEENTKKNGKEEKISKILYSTRNKLNGDPENIKITVYSLK